MNNNSIQTFSFLKYTGLPDRFWQIESALESYVAKKWGNLVLSLGR